MRNNKCFSFKQAQKNYCFHLNKKDVFHHHGSAGSWIITVFVYESHFLGQLNTEKPNSNVE